LGFLSPNNTRVGLFHHINKKTGKYFYKSFFETGNFSYHEENSGLFVPESYSLWILRDKRGNNDSIYHEYDLTKFQFTNKVINFGKNTRLSTYFPIIDHDKKVIVLIDMNNNSTLNFYKFPNPQVSNKVVLPKEFHPHPLTASYMNIDFKREVIIYFDGMFSSCGRGGLFCIRLLGYNYKTKKSFITKWTFRAYSLREDGTNIAHPFYNTIHDNKFYFIFRNINNGFMLSTCDFNETSFCDDLKITPINGCLDQFGSRFIFRGLKIYD